MPCIVVYICNEPKIRTLFTIVKFVFFTFVNMKEFTNLKSLIKSYPEFKIEGVDRRYLNRDHIKEYLDEFSSKFEIREIGRSVLGEPIQLIKIGSGEKRILAWSQMHGNEATTTRAIFDLLNLFYIEKDNSFLNDILAKCEILIIPMLNPDGARVYTRVNANDVDLNRDLQALSQPESKLLNQVFKDFKPHFCLNLHDQRTIFSAGDTAKPASLSFLTPASDAERSITGARKKSMRLVTYMNDYLQTEIPGGVGRYDDAFNINCAGDSFQSLDVPTILFEAGHYPGDYNRETTRRLIFEALLVVLSGINESVYLDYDHKKYFKIPENRKNLRDIILRRVSLENEEVDISIQFYEELEKNHIQFIPKINKIAKNIEEKGLKEIDAGGKKVDFPGVTELTENVIVNKIVLNEIILELKCE